MDTLYITYVMHVCSKLRKFFVWFGGVQVFVIVCCTINLVLINDQQLVMLSYVK